MLQQGSFDLKARLAEVGREGACHISGMLSGETQSELLACLRRVRFQRAPKRAGEVGQDFEEFVLQPSLEGAEAGFAPPAPNLAPILGLCEEYTALVRATAQAIGARWLEDFAPTDIAVQRYRTAVRGITPHRDRRRYVKLISVFSLGSPAEFRLCRDRQGSILRSYRVASGDLMLLRAPGFAEDDSPGPLHAVAGPEEGVRYSIGFRMEKKTD